MVQKTITLDADAVERLERARQSPDESLSSVVRRAVWTPPQGEGKTGADLLRDLREQQRAHAGLLDEALTGGQILDIARQRMANGSETVSEDVLDALDAAQASPRRSESEWRD